MDVPSLFYRMAELTEESLLAELIRGNRVMIHGTWYIVGKRAGKVVFLDGAGNDYSFSDLSVIEKVEWVSPKTEPTKAEQRLRLLEATKAEATKAEPTKAEATKAEPNPSVADVLNKLGR